MTVKIVLALATYYMGVGIYLLVAPVHFYENTSGVAEMGPFNSHFITDVALAFLASSGGLFWGALKRLPQLVIVGAALPLLHGLFHIQIWITRGLPFDTIALSDWAGVILPGLAIMIFSLRFARTVR